MSVTPEEAMPAGPVGSAEGAITTAPGTKPISGGIVRVNLIPAEIAEARALRTTLAIVGGAAVVVAAGVGFLWHQQTSKQDAARAELTAAQTENTRLQGEQQRLGNVNGLYAKVDSASAMYQAAASPQVLWSRYLEDLRLQLPDHVWLTSFAVNQTGSAGATTGTTSGTGASTSKLTPSTGTAAGTGATSTSTGSGAGSASSIGTITMAGTAYTHLDVADLLDKLATLRGVTSPYLSSSAETLIGKGSAAVPTVNFNLTGNLTSDALKSAYEGTPKP